MFTHDKDNELSIVVSDLNTEVGFVKVEGWTVNYDLVIRNVRKDRLIQWCQDKYLMIANTLFKLLERSLYTLRSPEDRPNKVVQN